MMLTILISIILLWSFYTGYRRGLIYELVYSIGYTISFACAWMFYKQVGDFLSFWIPYPTAALNASMTMYTTTNLSRIFYNGLGFIAVFICGWLITRFIGVLCYKLTNILHLRWLNKILGAFLNTAMSYIFLVIILTILSVIPITNIQTSIANSNLAQNMITNTPVISEKIQNEWFNM